MRLRHFVAAAALCLAVSTAHADDLFTLTDGTNTITFELPSPTTLSYNSPCSSPDLACAFNVAVTVNGATQTGDTVAFYDAAQEGGLTINPSGGGYLVGQVGDVLYTGSITNPTFTLGTFDLTDYSGFANTFSNNFTLNITAATATPEPSGLALLGTGLLALPGILRKRFA